MNKKFGLLKDISISKKSSWQGKLFLTLDIDWAPDFIIDYCSEILVKNNIKATWFVTHRSKAIDNIKGENLFDLGIHPNLNDLLYASKKSNIAISDIVYELKQYLPKASVSRCHSLTYNTRFLDILSQFQISHEASVFIPSVSGFKLAPYKQWNGVISVPHFWEDDLSFFYEKNINLPIANPSKFKGLRIYDFHPIHLFINTKSINHYNDAKKYMNDFKRLKKYINKSNEGVKDRLMRLIK